MYRFWYTMASFEMVNPSMKLEYNNEKYMMAIMGTAKKREEEKEEETFYFEKIIFINDFSENLIQTYIGDIITKHDLQTQSLEVDTDGKIITKDNTKIIVGGNVSDIKLLVLLELNDNKFIFKKLWAYKGELNEKTSIKEFTNAISRRPINIENTVELTQPELNIILNNSVVISDAVIQDDNKETYPTFDYKGIVNGKNYCYINAAIQLLFSIDTLRTVLNNNKESENTILVFKQLWNEYQNSKDAMKSISEMKDVQALLVLEKQIEYEKNQMQQLDAYDFIMYVCNIFKNQSFFYQSIFFEEEKIYYCKSKNDELVPSTKGPSPKTKNISLEFNLPEENLIFSKLQTRISDLLNSYLHHVEEIEIGGKCDDNKIHKTETKISCDNTDYILIHLKRYSYSNKQIIKIDSLISFDKIDICNNSFQPIGCILHIGDTVQNGHYVYAVIEKSQVIKIIDDKTIIHDQRIIEKSYNIEKK